MPFAIVLFFDQVTEEKVSAIWNDLSREDIFPEQTSVMIRPHITLAVFENLDCLPCEEELNGFITDARNLDIRIAHIGMFFKPEAVLFLAPTVTAPLLNLHAGVHKYFQEKSGEPWEIYQPGNWVPHCTLAINLDWQKLAKALVLCSQLKLPMNLRAGTVSAVEFVPGDDFYRRDISIN